jgi:hypothetical protein
LMAHQPLDWPPETILRSASSLATPSSCRTLPWLTGASSSERPPSPSARYSDHNRAERCFLRSDQIAICGVRLSGTR